MDYHPQYGVFPPETGMSITNVSVVPSVRPQTDLARAFSLHNLPSVYLPDPVFGLMHLPRFLKKIRHHLDGTLPASYQKNFTKGFDGLLCLHLGLEPGEIIEIVEGSSDEADVYKKLRLCVPEDVKANEWNRMITQMGLKGERRQQLEEMKARMGLSHRTDILTFADLIEYEEGRIG